MKRLTSIAAVLLAAGAGAAPREIAWTPPADMTFCHGYRLWIGPASRTYTNSIDVGMATNIVIDLPTNRNVYLALTAYNAVGIHGRYSAELAHDVEDKVGRPDPPAPRWVEAVVAWLRRVLGIGRISQ
jgi:hypothetical protein